MIKCIFVFQRLFMTTKEIKRNASFDGSPNNDLKAVLKLFPALEHTRILICLISNI